MVSDSFIVGNLANGGYATFLALGGGGIAASGNLVITATTISGNSTKSVGGGIFQWGTATITGCTISGNSAIAAGGGISGSNLTVTNSIIRDNSASGGGGVSSHGALVVSDSLVSGNSATGNVPFGFARHGGGIQCYDGTLVVAGATISGNSSRYDGGGVWGGINATVSITNSTVSGNSASIGGGVSVSAGATISHSTIVNNSAQILGGGLFSQSGMLDFNHSIVAANSAPLGRDATGLIGTTIAPKFSLIGWNAESGLLEAPVGSPDVNGNLIGGPIHGFIDPLLGPLADNGGRTMTHALLPDSPAINTGDPSAVPGVGDVPLFDQRSEPFTRVFGGRIDIGAFEAQPNPLAGDYNFNGVVDAADYVVWRDTQGSFTDLRADGNGDGKINEPDRTVWRANFGRTRTRLGAGSGEQKADPHPPDDSRPLSEGEVVAGAPAEPVAEEGGGGKVEGGGTDSDAAQPAFAAFHYSKSNFRSRPGDESHPAQPSTSRDVQRDAALVAWLASRFENEQSPREPGESPTTKRPAEDSTSSYDIALDRAFDGLALNKQW